MMERQEPGIAPRDFALAAEDDLEAWGLVLGKQVTHYVYGRGTVCRVSGSSHRLRIDVSFHSGEYSMGFTTGAFLDEFFTELALPLSKTLATLAELKVRRKLAAEERQQQLTRQAEEKRARRLREEEERLARQAVEERARRAR